MGWGKQGPAEREITRRLLCSLIKYGTETLSGVCGERTQLLLALDDAHYLDTQSWELIEHFVQVVALLFALLTHAHMNRKRRGRRSCLYIGRRRLGCSTGWPRCVFGALRLLSLSLSLSHTHTPFLTFLSPSVAIPPLLR